MIHSLGHDIFIKAISDEFLVHGTESVTSTVRFMLLTKTNGEQETADRFQGRNASKRCLFGRASVEQT